MIAGLKLRRIASATTTRASSPLSAPLSTPQPAVAHFHPELIAGVMVCGSAAEQWAGVAENPQTAIKALCGRGVHALVLAADAHHCHGFAKLATAFDGERWRSPLAATTLVHALRTHVLLQRPATTVPGVMLQVGGTGVLLRGRSGSGKSSLALELVARGHALVADDAVELRAAGPGCIIASTPEPLVGFLAVPGLGIINATRVFGHRATVPRTRLDLVIDLQPAVQTTPPTDVEARLHGCRSQQRVLSQMLPTLSLQARLGHNLATCVEVACSDHWLRLNGYRADQHFLEQQQRRLDQATPATT